MSELAVTAPSARRRLLGLAAGTAILGFLVYGIVDGWGEVREFEWMLRPELLLASGATLLLFYLASGLGYVAIIGRLVAQPPAGSVTLSIWARSLLGRYVPGNVLMVLGRVVLGHQRGIPRRATLAATVYEQALALAIAGVGGIAFLALYGGALGAGGRLWALAAVPPLLVMLHPRIFGPASRWALARLGRPPLPRLLSMGQVAALAVWYVLAAALLGAGIWLMLRGAGGAAIGGPAFVGLGFLGAFALSMVAVVFPSGLGVREGAFALVLAQELGGSVALTLSVGTRLGLTAVELAFVAVAAIAGRGR